jgi:ribosomal protein S18 acetylase RimI-like enzyme
LTDIRLRPFQKSDLAPALDVWERAWRAGLAEADHGILDRGEFEQRLLTEDLPDHIVIVAEAESRPVGFMILWPAEAYIGHLAVDPAFGRRGVGRRLARAALDLAGGTAHLRVLKINPAARIFWQSVGARHLGEGLSRGGLPADSFELCSSN